MLHKTVYLLLNGVYEGLLNFAFQYSADNYPEQIVVMDATKTEDTTAPLVILKTRSSSEDQKNK